MDRRPVSSDEDVVIRSPPPPIRARSGLVGRRMHIAVRADPALRAGRGRIIDYAFGINGKVDHASLRSVEDLRLRSSDGLIGDQISECPPAIGQRIIMVRFAPGLNQVRRTVSDPILHVQILYLS